MFVSRADRRSANGAGEGATGRNLEERIAQWKIHDPYLHTRVAAETYETATSVLRIRNEAHRAARDSRVVVVPSDVALIYKPGKDFGGRTADKFKWVPIYHTDDRGNRTCSRWRCA
jgi:hypothetical protein